MKALWETTSINKYKDIHEFSARAVENLMKDALLHKTLDNITIVMISFKNLKNALFAKKKNNSHNSNNKIDVDKNGNLIIDSNFLIHKFHLLIWFLKKELDLIEYNYSPDNPNEGSMDESLNEKNVKQANKVIPKK